MARATASKTSAANTTAGTGGIVWSKRQRARLFGSLHPQQIDPVTPDGVTAWHMLRDLYGAPNLYALPPEADRAAERILGELREEFRSATPPATSTPERELLRLGLLLLEGGSSPDHKNFKVVIESLVPFWAGCWGPGFASRIVWTPGPSLGSIRAGDQRRAYLARRNTGNQTLGRLELWWLHLRRAILAASPEAHDEAHRVWHDAGADEFARAATFCRSPADAHALVAKQLAHKSIAMNSIALLSAIDDPQLALRFAQSQPLNYACGAELHAFHLVDNLGPAAAPVLLALLERVSSGTDARRALAAAAVLADPVTCKATLPKLDGPAATSLAAALK